MHIDVGSTINLTCIIQHAPEPPDYVFWTHNQQVNQAHFLVFFPNSYNFTLLTLPPIDLISLLVLILTTSGFKDSIVPNETSISRQTLTRNESIETH